MLSAPLGNTEGEKGEESHWGQEGLRRKARFPLSLCGDQEHSGRWAAGWLPGFRQRWQQERENLSQSVEWDFRSRKEVIVTGKQIMTT